MLLNFKPFISLQIIDDSMIICDERNGQYHHFQGSIVERITYLINDKANDNYDISLPPGNNQDSDAALLNDYRALMSFLTAKGFIAYEGGDHEH